MQFSPSSFVSDTVLEPMAMTHYPGGRTLKDSDEQSELLRLLRQVEQNTAYPTERGVQSLQDAWSLNSVINAGLY